MKISAIITLSPLDNTLGSLREFLEKIQVFNLEPSTELLDGGHIHINDDSPLMESHEITLNGLTAWVDQYEQLPDTTAVNYLTDLCVEPAILATDTIGCGEHVRDYPENIIVIVNPKCSNE
jgi:hypothetical protein